MRKYNFKQKYQQTKEEIKKENKKSLTDMKRNLSFFKTDIQHKQKKVEKYIFWFFVSMFVILYIMSKF